MVLNPTPKMTPMKAIVAGAGQVAALGVCLGTDAPPWLSAVIGVAAVASVYRVPNRVVATTGG